MDKDAEVGQRVRITWNGLVEFGKFAGDILWSSVEGVMGEDGVIEHLTYNGQDIECPNDNVVFRAEDYKIIDDVMSKEEMLELLYSMVGGHIAVLRWDDDNKAVIEKYSDGVWVFPGSEKEFTSEEIAKFRGLVRIDNLDWLL